jgi:hypothetical protein
LLFLRQGRLAAATATASQHPAAAELGQHAIAEPEDDDPDQPEARCDQGQQHPQPAAEVQPAAAATGTVFEMVAFGSFAKAHDILLPSRLQCFTMATVAIVPPARDS